MFCCTRVLIIAPFGVLPIRSDAFKVYLILRSSAGQIYDEISEGIHLKPVLRFRPGISPKTKDRMFEEDSALWLVGLACAC